MSNRRKFEQYPDFISRLFPEKHNGRNLDNTTRNLSRTVTFQVTDACNLACSYCYQIHKGTRRMSLDVAKKFIDLLLTGDKGMGDYINPTLSPAIVLDFIGGEPLLEIDLMDEIVSYFRNRAIELNHSWANMFSICISSNGTLYNDPKVKRFLEKNKNHMSFNITIDGNKELHDACRRFPDGRPSYDLAVAAAKDWMSKGYYMGSKITIAPGNVQYLYSAIIHMVELGYTEINANCVYEEGWNQEYAKIFYSELKKVADYWDEHDLYETHYLSLFEEGFFRPKEENDLDTWCFRGDTMVRTVLGDKRIDEITRHDSVITRTGQVEPVLNCMSRYAEDTIMIRANGLIHDIYTTLGHPFLVNKGGQEMWIKAGDLEIGDKLIAVSGIGDKYDVEVTETNRDVGPYKVYNLTIKNDPSYIANGVIVHNCGGTGLMIACDPDGDIYPCIRYMESSLGGQQKPLMIGNVDEGVGQTQCTHDCIHCLNTINRRTQSTDECFYCPIAEGCSYCSAYNYQVNGTPNSRCTYICIMHKARALANVYFWNNYYEKHNIDKVFTNYCPEEWALEIIDKDELNMLNELQERS